MNTVTVRIETKGHRGPLQIKFDYDKNVAGEDIKVSVHTHAKVSIEDYIWQFEDRRKISLRPFKAFNAKLLTSKNKNREVDKNAWYPEAIYVQIFSVRGLTLHLTAVFSDEFALREKKKFLREHGTSERNQRTKFQNIVRTRVEEAVNVKYEIKKVNEEIRLLKLSKRIREKSNMDVNFVTMNIEGVHNHEEAKAIERAKSSRVREARTSIYKEKRIEEQEAKQLYNVLSLSKWDFLRVKRAEFETKVR